MKFFFSKTDSLYKIFKSLEKIPARRSVEIFIDPEHSLFDNEWRWQQIKEILDKNQIDATFSTKNKKNRDYLSSLWLKVNFEKEKHIQKTLNIIYLFLFNIKKFHLHTYESKKYLFAIIFWFEALVIIWILRFIISLLVPSASITIQPSENSETIIYNVRYYPQNDPKLWSENRFLHIPYYTWQIEYKHELTISTANSKYITNPSYWQIKIYNKRAQEYSFIKDTQFITSDWLLFLANSDFNIPAGNEQTPSETIITVRAAEYDEGWNLIWVRWNIKFKTQMLIKKSEESFLTKDIRAESVENFHWRDTENSWTVTQQDIQQIREKITLQAYEKKMSVVNENFPISWWMLLPFDTITTTRFNDIQTDKMDGQDSPTIKWTAYVTYTYAYVMRDDLYQIFMTYVKERPLESNSIVKINKDSIQFLKDSNTMNTDEIKRSGNSLTIPTQIDVFQIYDFEKDPKQIISSIKDKIAWMSIEDARNYILSAYDEIWSAKISVPLRYNSIPLIKSRIKFSYK